MGEMKGFGDDLNGGVPCKSIASTQSRKLIIDK